MSTHVPQLCSLRGPRNSDTATATSTPTPRSWFLNVILPLKGTRAPSRNGWYQCGGQGRYKVSLDILLH